MENIGKILLSFLKEKGFYDRMMEFHSIQIYNTEIIKEFPEIDQSRAVDIKDGVMNIVVPNSMLNWQVNLKKLEIVERINHIYGKKIIKDLYTKIEG